MICLLPTPSLWRSFAASLLHRTCYSTREPVLANPVFAKRSLVKPVLRPNALCSLVRSTRQQPRPRPFKQEAKNTAPSAAMSGSVSRTSNPQPRGDVTAAYRSVAHLFLARTSTTLADQRRTDEASRPDWANRLPGHPAPLVRSVRTVGSPQSCSGARNRCSRLSRVDSVAET
jgi:hypothetical protein